jgi:DNA-binding response OmpR family regulator
MSVIKAHILCVDDHDDSSYLVKAVLSSVGHEVTTASSIAEALEAALSTEFDLYMLDGKLGDGSGSDLRQRLRELHPQVPTLFFTGMGYQPEEVRTLQQHGDGYLRKPATPAEIQTAVQRLL